MMKKEYTAPDVSVTRFDKTEILTASGGSGDPFDSEEDNDINN